LTDFHNKLKTLDPTHEITASPSLLNRLDIEHSLITLDGIGCQTDSIVASGVE